MSGFLNWRTDSMLVDPVPLEQNKWFTANELIEVEMEKSFITSIGQLLLYPVIVRKIDFVSGERILQSFPYILLDDKWINIIRKQSLSLAEKNHYYFLNSNYNRSIRVWQKKIINYLEEQGRIPLPIFRLANNWLDYFKNKKNMTFQSARGEIFQLPLFLSEDLAYLTGVVMGDGHLAEYFVNIIDSSKVHIQNLKQMLKELFDSKTEFFKQPNANAWNVNLLGKWIVRFFNFLSGQPIAARKYAVLREPLVLQKNDCFRSRFWSGLMDADGSYKNIIGFATASKQLRSDFSHYLNDQNIQHRFSEYTVFGGTTFSLIIAGESRKKFASLIGTNHSQKKQELNALLKRKFRGFLEQAHTLQKRGEWKGQVYAFSEKTIIDDYFDFRLISDLQVLNLGSYIKSLRKKHNQKQKDLSNFLDISQSLLSKYELNKTSIPIHFLQKILSNYNISNRSFFSQFNKLIFRSINSSCQFPTRSEERLLELIKGLQIKSNNYIRIIGLSNKSNVDYWQEISDFFLIKNSKESGFHNSCLKKLIKTYCIIRN